ncbi:MAG TPA: hypothetical protein VLU43_07200, partial [Anaeromyxobacteraceae bacterium]|nr:hypothetical protein [Anaeromyxobacteraceae bacterium]
MTPETLATDQPVGLARLIPAVLSGLLLVAACATPDVTPKPTRGQCPPNTFIDNSANAKQAVNVTGNADVLKQTGGVALSMSGEGEARITCRQLCAGGTRPHVEEASGPLGTTFKYVCEPADGTP